MIESEICEWDRELDLYCQITVFILNHLYSCQTPIMNFAPLHPVGHSWICMNPFLLHPALMMLQSWLIETTNDPKIMIYTVATHFWKEGLNVLFPLTLCHCTCESQMNGSNECSTRASRIQWATCVKKHSQTQTNLPQGLAPSTFWVHYRRELTSDRVTAISSKNLATHILIEIHALIQQNITHASDFQTNSVTLKPK